MDASVCTVLSNCAGEAAGTYEPGGASPARDLTGCVTQVLDQKHKIQAELNALKANSRLNIWRLSRFPSLRVYESCKLLHKNRTAFSFGCSRGAARCTPGDPFRGFWRPFPLAIIGSSSRLVMHAAHDVLHLSCAIHFSNSYASLGQATC